MSPTSQTYQIYYQQDDAIIYIQSRQSLVGLVFIRERLTIIHNDCNLNENSNLTIHTSIATESVNNITLVVDN